MEHYQRYEIRKTSNGEYSLLLYFDEYLTEFADELGREPKVRQDIVTSAKQIIIERYPNFKVTMVKVLISGIVVTSIPLTINKPSAEATGTSTTIAQVSQSNSVYYQVSEGDSLWNLSRKFNTSVDNIKGANNLTSDVLQLNQHLIIPLAFHTVATGDYLTVLAKKYGTSVEAIKEVNNLTNDSTRPGQILIIPAVIGGTNSTPSTVPTQSEITTYTVVSGDSLSAIAKRFGTTINAIKSTNNLTSDFLRVGQTLTIFTSGNGDTTEVPTAANKTSSYTVVSGDSLSVIAKRYGITVDYLKSSNNLTTDFLRVGQVLIIPPGGETSNVTPTSYTVVLGDSLSGIAQRFGTNVLALKSINNLTSDTIRLGQTLIIPKGNPSTIQTVPTPAPEQEPTIEDERETFTYQVSSGDNLSVIANRFGVTVDSIRTTNNLKSDTLQIGLALTIPNGINTPTQTGANTITYLTHTVASGDNIWDLSVRYGIPQTELLKANNLTTSSRLSIGQKLKVPVHNIAVKQVVSEKYGEFMDWWTEAQYVFAIGKTAKVTDFATGKSFYIKRTLGANHSDSETMTVNDSNIAKSIWGGYSWTARAVILEVDGRKVAASMSFMPHDRDFITNNGITGHFDVYFGNSTRHIDGKADASHQAQVERAAGLR